MSHRFHIAELLRKKFQKSGWLSKDQGETTDFIDFEIIQIT
jgi:hypothetical protein